MKFVVDNNLPVTLVRIIRLAAPDADIEHVTEDGVWNA